MNELFEKNPYFRELSSAQKQLVKFRFILSRLIKRTALIDFVQYNYFLLNGLGQRRFISIRKRKVISRKLNDAEKTVIFDNKALFNEHFSRFINRRWLDLRTSTVDEFLNFLKITEEVVIKPIDGSFGIGIKKVKSGDIKNAHVLFNEYMNRDFIIEESVKQHREFAEFNESSFNTFRVVTINHNNNVEIFGAVFRIGREGSIVDNHHSGGLSAIVDVETGIIKTPATDQSFASYVLHPDSKKQIVGYKVPYWEDIVSTVKDAALVHSEVGYVGWDVGINDRGETVIVEGNHKADPDVLQRADQIGKWPDMLKYL